MPNAKRTAALREWFSRPERVMVFGFMLLILLGSGLLCLPAASADGKALSWFDSLFTATSAVCVTGLVAVDTGTAFSTLGHAILLVLIQVGGLGFMVFATLLMGTLGRRVSLRGRALMRDSLNGSSMTNLVGLAAIYFVITLAVEFAGAVLLAFSFVPRLGWGKGIWFAFFHSVSAFCNAGFDLNGNYSSLTAFAGDPWVLLVVSMLIILGGIGFFVILEVVQPKKNHGLTLHTRIALIASGVLLVFGTLFYLLVEWNNPGTLNTEGANFGTKLLNAFFQSVTMRTAGFNSVDLAALTPVSKLVSSMLMFIGASPASTGGGVKTTTITVLLLAVVSTVGGRDEITAGKKRLDRNLVARAVAVVMIAFGMLMTGAIALSLIEGEAVRFIDILFEAASAVGTAGVSAAGTPTLHAASRVLLIPMMFLGRVGPLTLATALAARADTVKNHVRYPEENVMIG